MQSKITRYLLEFRNNTFKYISVEEAEKLIPLLNNKDVQFIGFRGAFLSRFSIDGIKPITREWFDKDFVESKNYNKNQPTLNYDEKKVLGTTQEN